MVALKVLGIIFGVILVLPGLCSLVFMAIMLPDALTTSNPIEDTMQWMVLWIPTFVLAGLGGWLVWWLVKGMRRGNSQSGR